MHKKALIIAWLTAIWFALLVNVHAWEIPPQLRLNGGARLWFSLIDGDLTQSDRTKLDILDNLGIEDDNLAWEFFLGARFRNIHVLRLRGMPTVAYDQSRNDSYVKMSYLKAGYDLDFFMTPQALFGGNFDLSVVNVSTKVNNVVVGNLLFNYEDNATRVFPGLGVHGTFYPIMEGIALRPLLSARVNWWDYESLSTYDWEVSAAVDVPISQICTWTINGGYRIWNLKQKRTYDTTDTTLRGFFLETSLLF